MSAHSDLKTFHDSTPGQFHRPGHLGTLLELNIKNSAAILTMEMPMG